MSIYCLFVGINFYKENTVNNLGGCENDVNALQKVLSERFDITSEDIVILLNEDATRASIIDNLQNHLGKAKEGDTALFYFSGHGSQELADERFWEIENDKYNETLVCHDSRSDSYDLADKELRFLIKKISLNKPRIITIIDSCHSGGATRGEEDQVRQISASNNTRPIESYIFYKEAKDEGWLDNMSKLKEGAHIEMSACRDLQLSKEKYVGTTKHGVFTYYLKQTLELAHHSPSYRNLNAIVSQKVQATVRSQHPQVNAIGDLDLYTSFLDSTIEEPKFQIFFKDNSWWVNAGFPQGINTNARLLVTIKEKSQDKPAITCEADVVDVLNDKSLVKIIDVENLLHVNEQYQSFFTDPAIPKLPICLRGNDAQIHALREKLKDNKLLEEVDKSAKYQIKGSNASYELSRIFGLPVFAPKAALVDVLQQAEKMAYWERALNLAYATGELPNNCVNVVIEQYNHLDNGSGYYSAVDYIDNEVDLFYHRFDNKWYEPTIKITIKLNPEVKTNENKLYISLLFLDSISGEINVLVNNQILIRNSGWNQLSQTQENEVHEIPLIVGDESELTFTVSEKLLDLGIVKTTDYLKLFITNFENDMSSFAQPGFKEVTRSMTPKKASTPKFIFKSSTQTLTLNTIRPLKVKLQPDETLYIGDSIRILPNKINALITLETPQTSAINTKSVESSKDIPEIFQNNPTSSSVSLNNHPGIDDMPTVIRIELAEPDTRSPNFISLSEENPLIIEIDKKLENNELILPYAKDGEFFIPLGYSRKKTSQISNDLEEKTHIIIDSLPSSSSETEGDSRSVGGSILIFLRKIVYDKLKLETDTTQLAIPEFTFANQLSVYKYNKDITYIKDKVGSANKVLLFVHGILGDTKTMAGSINAKLSDGQTIGDNYDVVLTFDYENLNTPIAETAEALIKKLAKLGLDESHNKQLDIVAHSMGGLVSRWMIEKNPAAPKVNKLVMLGTPNGGSPLSDVKKWAFGTLTLALNGIALTGITGLTISILGRLLNSADETLDEMDKNSKTLEFLYEAKDPNIPYYLIAGNTENLRIQLDDKASKFSRFMSFLKERSKLAVADLFTDKLFGEANDIAVSQASMQYIPKGRNHALMIVKVDCDHTSYFVESKSLQQLFVILSENK